MIFHWKKIKNRRLHIKSAIFRRFVVIGRSGTIRVVAVTIFIEFVMRALILVGSGFCRRNVRRADTENKRADKQSRQKFFHAGHSLKNFRDYSTLNKICIRGD